MRTNIRHLISFVGVTIDVLVLSRRLEGHQYWGWTCSVDFYCPVFCYTSGINKLILSEELSGRDDFVRFFPCSDGSLNDAWRHPRGYATREHLPFFESCFSVSLLKSWLEIISPITPPSLPPLEKHSPRFIGIFAGWKIYSYSETPRKNWVKRKSTEFQILYSCYLCFIVYCWNVASITNKCHQI